MKQRALRKDRDGEARDLSSEDGGSGHFERSRREGNARRGLKADGVPRIDATTVEHQVRKDRAGVAIEARQPVGRNRAPRSGPVDSSSLEEGLWLPDPGRRHGKAEREVRGR